MATVRGQQRNSFSDASGKVFIAVFDNHGDPEQEIWHQEIAVGDESMVAIGGGGTASDGNVNTRTPGPGALLTASRPNENGLGWIVESRDHQVPQAYGLHTFVIGMKIAGLSRDELLRLISFRPSNSGEQDHAEASSGPPDGHILIGGGFQVEFGKFNLATASFPSSDFRVWKARSQDHLQPSPANLTVWAISIQEILPKGIGRVRSVPFINPGNQAPHPSAVASVDPGFALTGGGAEVVQVNNGNFLWQLEPSTSTDPNFTASSKDHIVSAPCPINTYAIGIQII